MLLSFALAALAAPPSVDEPLRTGARAAEDVAVVVGIEDYAFVPDVPYAGADAAAFGDLLAYTRGVPDDRVHRLRDASREQILRAVRDAAGQVGAGGTLWVYFAGHGAASPTDGSRMLLGVDVMADPAAFAERAVTVAELKAAAGSARTALILDTCYSGVGRSGAGLAGGTRFLVPAYAMAPQPGRVEWTAASANQLSAPLPAVGHGAFTYFAVGALRGWADGEVDGRPDGQVTLAEAQAYVARSLRSAGLAQQPELVVKDADDIVLVGGGKLEPAPELQGVDWDAGGSLGRADDVVRTDVPEGCPWADVKAVAADMGSALVDGVEYDVRGKEDRALFSSHLQTCGYAEAAEAFERWRKNRRTVNGMAVYPPLLWVAYFPAKKASLRREEFEAALREGR